jgi:hypothetical protein
MRGMVKASTQRQGSQENMIDPITLGIAFTAAQQSVSYIKKAIALGKDVNSLYDSLPSSLKTAIRFIVLM